MSKVFKCPVLSENRKPKKWVWISPADCEDARAHGHHYCKKCDLFAEPAQKMSIDIEKYVRLLCIILDDAADVFQKNDDRVEKLLKYWSKRSPPRRKSERDYFVDHLENCIEMKQDVGIARDWFRSDDVHPGSFVWICDQIGRNYDDPDYYTPANARKRMGL